MPTTEYYETTNCEENNSGRYTSEKPYSNENFSILVTKESNANKTRSPVAAQTSFRQPKNFITV